jgi:hypothetical protein
LRIEEIQEDLSRVALESAVGGLRRLERHLAATEDRAHGGRRLVVSSAHSGELPDRLAGLEETRAAVRRAEVLAPRIADAELTIVALREAFLSKRVEHRQAETLISDAEARDAIETARHDQQSLDDWYLNRLSAAGRARGVKESEGMTRTPGLIRDA